MDVCVLLRTSESSRADVPLGAAADMIGFGVLVLALEGFVASAIEINSKAVAFVAEVDQLCKNAVKPRARDQQQTIRREFNGCAHAMVKGRCDSYLKSP